MEEVINFIVRVLVISAGLAIYRWIANMIFTDGTLKIDTSNPDKDVYRIEIDRLDRLTKKRRIILKVDPKADLSQE